MSMRSETSSVPVAARLAITLVVSASALALVAGLCGCNGKNYKTKADEETYKILDEKWEEDFGQMVNYQVSDQTPDSNEIVAKMTTTEGLGLVEAVGIATQYNREYQRQKEVLYLSALDLTDTRHRYARQWFGTVDATYANNGGSDDVSVDSRVGVTQNHLLADGIQIGTGLAVDWTRFLTGDPRTSLASVLTATVSAPLLGAGAGKAARENLTQAERNVLYRVRTFNRFRKTFVVSIINDYYRVLQDRNSVGIAEASYQSRIESTNQLRMEVEVGQKASSELGEARQALLNAEQNMVSARQRYEQTLDTFKIQLALATDTVFTLDPNELNLLEEEGIKPIPYSAELAIEIALDRRLDLANTANQMEDTERKLVLAADGLGVQVNLVGSANVGSTADTDWTRLRFHEGAYALGVETDLLLDRKAERNAYREALIAVQQRQRAYDEQVDQIKLAVRQAYRNLAERAESYRIQQLALTLARERVEEEKLLLNIGRGTARLLLGSEDALVAAQDRVIGALVGYTIAKLSFFRDVGVLQVKPDGMWEQNTL